MKNQKIKSSRNIFDKITSIFPGIRDIDDQVYINLIEKIAIPLKHLLINPDIEVGEKYDGSVDFGDDHHGAQVVKGVANSIFNVEILNYYIRRITSHDYTPKNLKTLEINKKKDVDKYTLVIRDEKSPGYAVEVEYHANEQWKVLLLSKILSFAVKRIKEYPLSIKKFV